MRKIKQFTSRMVAVMLAGTLAVSSVSLSAFGAEDAGSAEAAAEEISFDETVENNLAEETASELADGEVKTESSSAETVDGEGVSQSASEEAAEGDVTELPDSAFTDTSGTTAEEATVTSYTVTLDANGGYFANEWDDFIIDYVEQAEVVVKHIPAGSAVTAVPAYINQDGHTMIFAGWSLERDGAPIYRNYEEYIPVDNCVLYAVWKTEDSLISDDTDSHSTGYIESDDNDNQSHSSVEQGEYFSGDDTPEDSAVDTAEGITDYTPDSSAADTAKDITDYTPDSSAADPVEVVTDYTPESSEEGTSDTSEANSAEAVTDNITGESSTASVEVVEENTPEGSKEDTPDISENNSQKDVTNDNNDSNIGYSKSPEYIRNSEVKLSNTLDNTVEYNTTEGNSKVTDKTKDLPAESAIEESVNLALKNADSTQKISFNGHEYQRFDVSKTWKEAEAYCEAIGGHLVTITSSDEQRAVAGLVSGGNKYAYWLGANKLSGSYKWVTDEEFSYTNWSPGEPNNLSGEFYVEMYLKPNPYTNSAAYQWNNIREDNTYYNGEADYFQKDYVGFVCEWDDTVKISFSQKYIGNAGEAVLTSVDINSPAASPDSSNMTWTLYDTNHIVKDTEVTWGALSVITVGEGRYIASRSVTIPDGGTYTLNVSFNRASADAELVIDGRTLKIEQPSENRNYAYSGNVNEEKEFIMTLSKAEEEPESADFQFTILRSGSLSESPSESVTDPNVDVIKINKTDDHKYEISFSYKPNQTGFYNIKVTYKDRADDTELMVYDPDILEELGANLDGTVKKYFSSYTKRVKSEINNIIKEEEDKTDYVLLAKEMMKDSSTLMNGSLDGSLPNPDLNSFNLCAFEAYVRYIMKIGSQKNIHFDKVDNETAERDITTKLCGFILDNSDQTNKAIALDSKVVIDGKQYDVKASWNIMFGVGQINLEIQNYGNNDKKIHYSVTNKKTVESAVSNYMAALKDLNNDALNNVARQFYEDLVDLLELDILKEIDSERKAGLKSISDDIANELENHGIKNIVDNVSTCRNYYKQAKQIYEKVKDAVTVLKSGKASAFDKITSLYEISNIKINTEESGDCAKDIYDLLTEAEKKWRNYMVEYYTTGMIKDLETENFLGTLKNGFKSVFKCPVSITVIDPVGLAAGYVGEEDIWFTNGVYIEEQGEAKIIYTPKEAGYKFEVLGTDDGLVSYTVQELTDGSPSGDYYNYYDIPVQKGTLINVDILSDTIQSVQDVSVISEEAPCQPTVANVSSKASVYINNDSGKGSVTGAAYYMIGDMATVKADPLEDYVFAGWYEGGILKTFSNEYQFEVREDTILTAAYLSILQEEEEGVFRLEGGKPVDAGKAGPDCTWAYYDNGDLIFSGSGRMNDLELTAQLWRKYDSSMKRVSFGNEITYIGNYAFFNCTELKEVVLPGSITEIADMAFSGCSGITDVYYPHSNSDWYALNPGYYNKSRLLKNGAVIHCSEYVDINGNCGENIAWKLDTEGVLTITGSGPIPDFEITNGPWQDQPITSVIFSDGITRIGVWAFRDCLKLRSVYIPPSVTSIDMSAFITGSESDKLVFYGVEGSTAESYANLSKSNFVPHKEHDFGNWTIVKEASTSCTGLKKRICSICKAQELVEIPILPTAISDSSVVVKGIADKTYTGKAITQSLTVTIDKRNLKAGTDYTVIYKNNTNAGTATVTINGKGNYTGIRTETFIISPAPITETTVTGLAAKTYTGKAITQTPVVKLDSSTLTRNTDYTVAFKNNVKAGTATVTITGKGNYTGTRTATFKINRATIAKAKVTCPASKVWAGWALTPVPTVKVGTMTLKKGTDFSLAFKNNKNVGTATITITGKGNYTGTVRKTFKINPRPTSISKLTGGSKKFTANWKKQASQTSGYQIQYSSRKDFKTQKIVTVSGAGKTSRTVSGLAKKHKYYVRIRTYKTIGKARYYSTWSAAKTVTTK